MIILSVDKQAEIFLLSVLLGAGAGFFYDAVKIIRLLIPHGRLLSDIEDGIYWIACALFVVTFMLEKNNGEIRLFSVTAFFAAMLIYSVTLSRFVMGISEKIAVVIKKIIMVFIEITLTPVKLVYMFAKPPAEFVRNKVKKRIYTVLILIKKYAKIKVITYRQMLHLNRK